MKKHKPVTEEGKLHDIEKHKKEKPAGVSEEDHNKFIKECEDENEQILDKQRDYKGKQIYPVDSIWEDLREQYGIKFDITWKAYWMKVFWVLREDVLILAEQSQRIIKNKPEKNWDISRVFAKMASRQYRARFEKKSVNDPSTS